jgi:hypothetical protein
VPGPLESCVHAGHDHRALELREHAEHLKHRPASGRGGIEALLVQIEVDTRRVNFT